MAKLFFYYSAMNAGKTTTLLQSSYNYRERGMKTLLYTPSIDIRYGEGRIASRIGIASEAIAFGRDFDFFKEVQDKQNILSKLACILIDEAQFLTKKQVLHLTRVVDELNIPVLTYGLRTDFLGNTFDGSHHLLALAEEIIEIKTICHCGRKAIMNARIDSRGNRVTHGNQIEIGGNESYEALCRKHFYVGGENHASIVQERLPKV